MSTITRPQQVARPPSPAAPELRVVEAVRDRPASGRLVLGLALFVMFGALLLSAVFHSVLVSGQRRLDRMERQVAQREQSVSRMRLRVAVLSSPQRVVAEAKARGMVEPDRVTWLIPGQPAGSPSPGTEQKAKANANELADRANSGQPPSHGSGAPAPTPPTR